MDIPRAVRAGRRARLVRRVAAGSSAAAVVTVVAVAASLLGGGPGGTGLPEPPSTSAEPSPTLGMPATAPARFDPLTQYADVGWVPDGVRGRSVTVTADLVTVGLDYQGLPTSGTEPSPATVYLMVAAAGRAADPVSMTTVEPAAMPAGAPAEPINGRPAEWVISWATTLRWEYTPGAWAAVVVADNLPGDDTRAVAREVAQSVRYGVNWPVTLPFDRAAVPAALPLAATRVHRYDGGWSVEASFGEGRTTYGDWPLSLLLVTTDVETGDGAVLGDPNTTLDGYPARTSNGIDGGRGLQVYNVEGIYVELLTHSPEATAALPAGLEGVFRALDLRGDPATWQ